MTTLRGLAQLNLVATDVTAAADWWSAVLGQAPYFQMPPEGPAQYVEFRFGDDADELGLMSALFRPTLEHPGGALVSFHVDDVESALGRLVELGATTFDPIQDRGHGFVTASVVDPFGNLVGLIHSPHWLARHQDS